MRKLEGEEVFGLTMTLFGLIVGGLVLKGCSIENETVRFQTEKYCRTIETVSDRMFDSIDRLWGGE